MLKADYEEFKKRCPKATQAEKGLFFFEQKAKGISNKEIYDLFKTEERNTPGSAKVRLSRYLKAAKEAGLVKAEDKMETEESKDAVEVNSSEESQTDSMTENIVDDVKSKEVSITVSSESWEKKLPEAEIRQIEREKLISAPSDWNFFQDLDEGHFNELVRSIEKYYIQHNLVVQELSDGMFRILSGHQRVRACDKLFETTYDEKYRIFPCKVYGAGILADEDARRIVIFTNTAQRGSLSLEDRIHSVNELTQLEKEKSFYGSKVDVKKEVAKILGVSRSAVFRLQNLSSLDKRLLERCGNKSEGKDISVREGEILSKLTAEQQDYIFVKEYYLKLNPKNLSTLKKVNSATTTDDIDKIFAMPEEYKYNVVTRVKRPEGFDTVAVHVLPAEKIKLGEILEEFLKTSNLSEETKYTLSRLVEELINPVS